MIGRSVTAAAAMAQAVLPATAEKPARVLASTGPWQVDYAPDACLLGRRFLDGKKTIVLGWRALPLEESVEMIVTRPSGDDRFRSGRATVRLASGASDDTTYESFPTDKAGYHTTRMRVPAAMFEKLADSDVVTIAPVDAAATAYELSNPAKAFAAFDRCNDDTLKTWGIDPAERQREATPAEALDDRRQWITASDYPMQIIHEGRQGTTAVLFRIAADGRIDQCRTVVTSGSSVLDEAACTALTKRGRYTPARDATGQPMAVHRVRRVVWRLPYTWNVNR